MRGRKYSKEETEWGKTTERIRLKSERAMFKLKSERAMFRLKSERAMFKLIGDVPATQVFWPRVCLGAGSGEGWQKTRPKSSRIFTITDVLMCT